MTQYIQNKNNCLILYYTDKNNKLQSTKISNYSIQGLFTLKAIKNFKLLNSRIIYLKSNHKHKKFLQNNRKASFMTDKRARFQ